MNSAKAKIFTTKIKENAHSLVGILKQYNIDSEVITMNDDFEIHTQESVADAARVIINKHIKKPRSANEFPQQQLLNQYKATAIIAILLIASFFMTEFGRYMDNAKLFYFSDVDYIRSIKDNRLIEVAQYTNNMDQINSGQFWRLITPSFLHKNLVHFLLILTFLIQFGRTIEETSGRTYLLAMCFISSILSNFLEFKLSNAHFGSMVGTIYCLYGFIWMRSLIDTKYAGKLNQIVHMFMLGLILSGFMNIFFINNRFGSLGDLAIGVAWGLFSAKFLPQNRLIPKKKIIY
ncbi:MAG: rhomboid family intramembrane serine protease [Lentisphaerales bacterium]|nr:rhomboid family intramembrane serine protease [Lentisphaerales bacterium]